jgi:hypothetical protein
VTRPASPADLARTAADAIMADLTRAERGVVVDSPPGAGKSTLVVRAAAELAAAGERIMVAGQTNEQVDDLVSRVAAGLPQLPVGRLGARGYALPERVARLQNVQAATNVADLAACPVVLGTAAKWATVTEAAPWPWAIVDEAYQMRSDLLLRMAGQFEKALFVGDPGQLDPFSTVETERWLGLSWDPMSSAVAVLLNHNPQIPVHTLPVSWRLPATAAPVVSQSFYPFTGFTSATTRDERQMAWNTRAFGTSAFDLALETAAEAVWALYELPHRHTLRTDAEAIRACAGLAARVLERGACTSSERSAEPLPVTPSRIAIGTAHRDQARPWPSSACSPNSAFTTWSPTPPTASRDANSTSRSSCTRCPGAVTRPPSTSRSDASASLRHATATPASSWPGPGFLSCSTRTPPSTRFTSAYPPSSLTAGRPTSR